MTARPWSVQLASGLLLALMVGCSAKEGQLRLVGEDPQLDVLGWLSGSWTGVVDGARVEEHWSVPAGGSMLGMNRTVVGGRTVFFEYLRIEAHDESIVYLASPRGRYPPTPFTMAGMGERQVSFENPEHDFPQRIVYAREGESLHARIEGTQDGETRTSEWTMLRATIATRDD
jgi:hypothetical protein